MAFKAYDFNQPIIENRDEIFLIKTYGGLKNISEVVFYTMLVMVSGSNGLWKERYPGIDELMHMKTQKEIYDFTAHYNIARFMQFLRKPKPELSLQDIFNDLAEIMHNASPKYGSINSLEIGIHQILGCEFLKKIYVCDLGGRTKDYNEYVAHYFKGYEQRVYMFEDQIKNVLNEHPEITTIFTDDADEIMEYLEYCEGMEDTKKLNEKQFFIMANPSYGKDKDGKLKLMYMDYFNECPKRFNCVVTWMNSHYIDLKNHNPGVIL